MIVIAEYIDFFIAGNRIKNNPHCLIHVFIKKRVMEVVSVIRIKKLVNQLLRAQISIPQKLKRSRRIFRKLLEKLLRSFFFNFPAFFYEATRHYTKRCPAKRGGTTCFYSLTKN